MVLSKKLYHIVQNYIAFKYFNQFFKKLFLKFNLAYFINFY